LESFYREAESILSSNFLHHQPIYRPFFSLEEQNEWMAKEGDEAYALFLDKVLPQSMGKYGIQDTFGGLLLKGGGYLDVPAFLQASKQYLMNGHAYIEEAFDEARLEIGEYGIKYGDWEAKHIIYANGLSASQSRFWSFLPFHALKGEILDIKGSGLAELNSFILNRGVFVFQNASGTYRCGSTYNWRNPDLNTTEEGKQEVLGKLDKIFKDAIEVEGHKVGIRPSTIDRKPFAGLHPEYKQVSILSGLGTKGVSLAPYFSAQLIDLLLNGNSVDPKVDIARYLS
jgi:glycine/D-amino acid oxidase-like deaminating enzyme